MSKFYKGMEPMQPSDYKPLKNWHPATSAPKDGKLFMGQQAGTNKAFAVKWNGSYFVRANVQDIEQVELLAWISFTEYADIRECVWRRQ